MEVSEPTSAQPQPGPATATPIEMTRRGFLGGAAVATAAAAVSLAGCTSKQSSAPDAPSTETPPPPSSSLPVSSSPVSPSSSATGPATIPSTTVAPTSEVQVYSSSAAGDRLARKPALAFRAGAPSGAGSFVIDPTKRFQAIEGFGASFNEAGLIAIDDLPPDRQEDVFRSLFDVTTGAGFSAMKSVIGATDFMSAGPFYTYDDSPGNVPDPDLQHFSIARDLEPTGLVTYIHRAQKYGRFKIQSVMDFPPNWMLVEQTTADGTVSNVDRQYFPSLARYYQRYLAEYAAQGVTIEYLSPFNEPGVYTRITVEEITDLVKNHLGPLFEQANVTTKIQLCDFTPRAELPELLRVQFGVDRPSAEVAVPVLLEDPDVRKYVSSISYHGYDFIYRPTATQAIDLLWQVPPTRENGYDFREFTPIAALTKTYPDVSFWQSETCFFGTLAIWVGSLPTAKFEFGDFWGRQIMADLEAGASAWLYWNMVLDERGGPWLVAPEKGNPDDNGQNPLVIVNRQTKQVEYTGGYFYLAHFSKFVRPGAVRIGVAGELEDVKVMAFHGIDGQLVAEVINSGRVDAGIQLVWHDTVLDVTVTAQSISTYLWHE